MDIDLLSKMVKELILDNDRVVLPGLGAFVAEVVPATFSDKGYTINPPYRKLYFRSKPDEGQSLINFYASSNNLDHEVADKIIRDFVSELKSIVFLKKVVLFPGLGRLRATKENALFFVADENLDIYPEGVGLEPISLKTHQETQEEISAALSELDGYQESAVPALVVEEESDVVPELEPEPEAFEVKVVESVEPVGSDEPELLVEPVDGKSGGWRAFFKVVVCMILTAAVLLAVFVAVSRLDPHLFDRVLYTPEELEIINR